MADPAQHARHRRVIWYGALVRRYRLLGGEIVIERAWLTMRLPLAGLIAVETDREPCARLEDFATTDSAPMPAVFAAASWADSGRT